MARAKSSIRSGERRAQRREARRNLPTILQRQYNRRYGSAVPNAIAQRGGYLSPYATTPTTTEQPATTQVNAIGSLLTPSTASSEPPFITRLKQRAAQMGDRGQFLMNRINQMYPQTTAVPENLSETEVGAAQPVMPENPWFSLLKRAFPGSY